MAERPSLGDGDFDYDDQMYTGTSTMGRRTSAIQNQHHDEEVALSESESFAAGDDPPKIPKGMMSPAGGASTLSDSFDYESHIAASYTPPSAAPAASTAEAAAAEARRSTQDRERPLPASSLPAALATAGPSPQPAAAAPPGLPEYNALEYKDLAVPPEVKELFAYIGQYKPATIELEAQLKPFVPDYVPTMGGCDEFLKVPRPDGRPDYLGLKALDEPAAKQSDPTLLNLQLRQLAKDRPAGSARQADAIGRIQRSDGTADKRIDQWVASVAELSRGRPAAGGGGYRKPLPDVEALMQEWPAEVEAQLRALPLPGGHMDLDLPTFTKAVCAVLDIPVYDNPIDSLHLLFTTLLEFRSNPFFKQAAGGGSPGGMPSEGGRPWSEAGTAAGSTGGWGGPGGLGAPAMGSGVGRTLSRMMSTASSGSGNMARASPLGGNVNVMAF